MKNIWIFAEQIGGEIQPVYYELLGKARELYPHETLTAVLFGSDNARMLTVLRQSGADFVISAEHPRLSAYHPDYHALALSRLAKTYSPDIILMGATPVGSELAPTVAAKLETGLAAHCTDICTDENGGLVTIIPAFGGKLLGEIIPIRRPAMATVRPGVFQKSDLQEAASVTITEADVSFLTDFHSGITLIGTQEGEAESGSITDAETVICVGLGIGSQENWEKAEALSRLLKGTLGYTRPTVDMGYAVNENSMVGTSGKTIHPDLYISCGVSGATHHVCGMKDSKVIISVNSDENAAIFNVSDYKLVGDCGQVLDELLAALQV